MKLLLDTHTLLWFGLADPRLSDGARSLIADSGNDVYLSPASYWEIAIKLSLGKYKLVEDLVPFMERQIEQNDLQILHISLEHVGALVGLPFHHKDPFDRLLIAQAMVEQVPLVSADAVFDRYAVTRFW